MDATREHFISENAYIEYERGIDWFYKELVFLNSTIFILQKIAEFPFRVFGASENTFFTVLISNFLTSAVLIITRLTTDQGNSHTFPRFRKRLGQLIKSDYHDILKPHLREAKLYQPDQETVMRVKRIRDAYVAHLNSDFVSGQLKFDSFDMSDLVSIRDCLNAQFRVLKLQDSTDSMMIFLEYSPLVTKPRGVDPRSDIEQILDNIAHISPILHLPDEDPTVWEFQRTLYNETELAQINHYRKKFRLPEA